MKPIGVPGEDHLSVANQPLRRRRILLQHDSRKPVLGRPVIPEHVHQVLPTVVVVKQRGVKAAAVQINRVGPVAVDARARHQVVVEIAQRRAWRARRRRAAVALHVRVNQIEQPVVMRQARRPDAARVGIAAHVELAGAPERSCQQPPVHEVARVMDLHARVPLERRCRDVVVVADANDRRIGIEPAKDWIANHAVRVSPGIGATRQRELSRDAAPARLSTGRSRQEYRAPPG